MYTEGEKGCCKSKLPVLPVAVIFIILALILIGFIVLAVVLAVRLDSLLTVSLSYHTVA